MKDKLREDLRDAIAKALADCIGHGMREKCERHADAVLAVLDAEGYGGAVTCQDALIYAGDQYTDKYKDDDRRDIKTDVLNAFYQGANWMRKTNPARSGVAHRAAHAYELAMAEMEINGWILARDVVIRASELMREWTEGVG